MNDEQMPTNRFARDVENRTGFLSALVAVRQRTLNAMVRIEKARVRRREQLAASGIFVANHRLNESNGVAVRKRVFAEKVLVETNLSMDRFRRRTKLKLMRADAQPEGAVKGQRTWTRISPADGRRWKTVAEFLFRRRKKTVPTRIESNRKGTKLPFGGGDGPAN